MKLRVIPTVVSLLISGTLLFGGWFAYQSIAMENPLAEAFERVEGVEDYRLDLNRSAITVQLQIDQVRSLREIYTDVAKSAEPYLKNRTLTILVDDHSSAKLDEIWSSALFSVAESMENRTYGDIPHVLEALTKDEGMTFTAEIDERNVYIRLKDAAEHVKNIILPRNPVQLGVWENE